MKILNLYAGIGGNRRLWSNTHDITAIEINESIANIYHEYYPDDKIIITDAHQYLLDHYKEYDFIWSSPPCPTHSRMQLMSVLSNSKKSGCQNRKAVYPEMSLYQQIILLKTFALKDCKWVIENVIPYYDPLISGLNLGRHLIWSNFYIEYKKFNENENNIINVKGTESRYDFNINKFKGIDKRKILRNCVNPEIGKYILDQAMNIQKEKQNYLFKDIA